MKELLWPVGNFYGFSFMHFLFGGVMFFRFVTHSLISLSWPAAASAGSSKLYNSETFKPVWGSTGNFISGWIWKGIITSESYEKLPKSVLVRSYHTLICLGFFKCILIKMLNVKSCHRIIIPNCRLEKDIWKITNE